MLGYSLNSEQKRIVLLSSMGGMLEFYDFTIYGLFAVYFAHQFFPAHNEFISIMESYAIFVVGYIVRPIGGIIFSHIGDEIGRKTVLILTMVLMGISSIGVALIPTYAQIGIYAPILMLLCRLLQGLAIGGELPSIIVYVSESMPDKCSYGMGGVFAGTEAGLIPGMLINLLITHYLTLEQINSFGWRIPFIIGGLLCFIAYQIRKKLHETKVFTTLKRHERLPIIELLHNHFDKLLIGIGIVAIMGTPIMLAMIFMPTYLIKIVKLNPAKVSDLSLIATIISVTAIYLMGIIAHKYNIYKLTRNCIILIFLACGLCYFMISQNYNLILAILIFTILQGFLVALAPIILSTIFPVNIRLTGVALSYNLSFVIFGGLTPIIVTGIIEKTNWIYLTPVLWMLITCLVTLFAITRARKYLPVKAPH